MAGPTLEAIANRSVQSNTIVTGFVVGAGLVAALAVVFFLMRRLERRREAELQTLAALALALAAAPDEAREVAEAAYVHSSRLFRSDFFQLGLFQGDVYRTLIWVRDGDRLRNREFAIDPEHQGLIGWIRQTGEELLVSDFRRVEDLPARPSYASDDPPLSGLFVPILVDGTVVGVVAAQSRRPGAFRRRELLLLKSLAGGLAAALAAMAWRDEVRQRERQLALVEDVARLLTPLRPLTEVMPDAAEAVARSLEADRVAVVQGTRDPWILLADAGQRTEDLLAADATEAMLREAGETMNLVARSRPGSEGGHPLWEAATPLRVQDRVLGVLYVNRRNQPFLGPDRRLIELVSSQLALAFLEASNFAQQQEEAWYTTVLLEVARHASRPGDMTAAVESVLHLTTLLAGAGWALLLIAEPPRGDLIVGPVAGLRRSEAQALAEARYTPTDFGLGPPFSDDGPRPVDLPSQLSRAVGATRALVCVLSDGSRLLGLLVISAEGFAPRRLELISGIAHQISLRLENAFLVEEAAVRRSLERELETARAIQESFLPFAPPEIPGWKVRAFWRAAHSVGGDFYDFIPLPDGPDGGRLGVVIADVTDKGVPAALYMALTRTLLRTIAPVEPTPAATLGRLNSLLLDDTRAEMFVSLWYGVWEPDAGRVTYANAGHSPPLLFDERREPVRLTQRQTILGVLPNVPYQDGQITLSPGALLLLYTDGVSEAQGRDGELFGVERIEAAVVASDPWEPEAVVEALERSVADFSGGHDPLDDLTIVCLLRRPTAHPALASRRSP